MGYSDRVYLLRVFSQVVPSAHTSPLLLKGGGVFRSITFSLSGGSRVLWGLLLVPLFFISPPESQL